MIGKYCHLPLSITYNVTQTGIKGFFKPIAVIIIGYKILVKELTESVKIL